MRKFDLALAFILLFAPASVFAASPLGTIESELSRLKVESALIVPSQAVDEHPIWSPDGEFLAANVAGAWYKISLAQLALTDATWRGGKHLGVLVSKESVTRATDKEVSAWLKVTRYDPRKIITRAQTTIELKAANMGVSLIVQKKGTGAQTIWTTNMENCHSLSLSPDDKFVAYVSEMNGVVVMKLSAPITR
jgi:Tol biopolymer transport system component